MKKIAILACRVRLARVLGSDLIESGRDVILVDQWPERVMKMKEAGLSVRMPGSEHHQTVNACHLHEIYTLNPQLDIATFMCKILRQ
jgi:2-dehydropantoate 2-reductase